MEGDIQFLIKHRSNETYFDPERGQEIPENGTSIVLNKNIHRSMNWTFEKVRGQWGYIKHARSGKIIHHKVSDNTLELHSDRHDGALFALDVYKHRVVHFNGCYAQPPDLNPNPAEGTKVILRSKVGYANQFTFVSLNPPNQEVNVYGKPMLEGKWEILSMIRKSFATHIEKLTVKVGKSRPKSKDVADESDIEYEISEGLDFAKIFKENFAAPISSDTWSEESTQTRGIHVEPAKTVVTWQYVFTLDHCGTTSTFRSNLLADTESELIEPEQLQRAPIEN